MNVTIKEETLRIHTVTIALEPGELDQLYDEVKDAPLGSRLHQLYNEIVKHY